VTDPTVDNTERDSAERTRQAREAVVLLKRVLTTYRSYAAGHDARKTATAELLRALQRFTATFGELALQITAKAFYFEDEVLLADEREEDSTTRPLFIEGIQALTLNNSIVLDELERFLSLWHIAANARFPDGRSLSTELWEADFKSVEMRMVENFAEGTEADDGNGAGSGRGRREELALALGQGMSAASLPGGSIVQSKGKTRFVSGADLLPLTSAAANGMTDDVLARLAAGRREVVNPLSEQERSALVAELTASAATLVRAHRTLWTLAPDAPPEDQEPLTALVSRVTRRFLDDGAIDLLRQGLIQTLQAARVDPERAAHVGAFFAPLASPEVVGPLVAACRDPAFRTDAVAVLAFLNPAAMGIVLDRIDDVVDDEAARTALLELVARKGTATEAFGKALASLSTATAQKTAMVLLETVGRMRPGSVVELLPACLAHPLPAIRRAVLARVPVDAVAGVAPLLTDAFTRDADVQVRRDLLGLLMRAKNPAAIPPLLSLAQRADVDLEERQTYLKAIATFGVVAGPLVAASVRRMFETEKDVDLRSACALVLGSVGDDVSRAMLDAEARRLFGNKTLKAACAEALKRLDARSAAGGRT
jgi:hypothetical protein